MKLLAVLVLVSSSAFGQMPNMSGLMSGLKDMSKDVMDGCKDDKSKVKGCESYTDMGKLKVCLMANKDKLSDKCKKSLKLSK